MYVFGGNKKDQVNDNFSQIALVEQCVLKHIGELPFRMTFGTCTAIREERLFMCFSVEDSRRCYHSDKLFFDNNRPNPDWDTKDSLFAHSQTRIASNDSKSIEVERTFASKPRLPYTERVIIVLSTSVCIWACWEQWFSCSQPSRIMDYSKEHRT